MSKSKVRWVKIVRTSRKDQELKKILEAVNKELEGQGLSPVTDIYEVVGDEKYGYSTRNILEQSEFKLVDRVVKKHLKKLGKKIINP